MKLGRTKKKTEKTDFYKKLIGEKYSHLTILDHVYIVKNNRGKHHFICKCDCDLGSIKTVACDAILKGLVTGCGCSRYRSFPPFQSSKNYLWQRYVKNAIRRDIGFNLSKEDFFTMISANCFYCGKEPTDVAIPSHMRKSNSLMNGYYKYNGIDRIDSNKPYEVKNIQTCCKTCNFMKLNHSNEYFLLHINKIYNNLKLSLLSPEEASEHIRFKSDQIRYVCATQANTGLVNKEASKFINYESPPNVRGGKILGFNDKNEVVVEICGIKDMKSKGFNTSSVYHCLNGKWKTYKGLTFKRI